MTEAKSCRACVHCTKDFTSDSDGFDIMEWWECDVRLGVQNLKQFPFKNTKCPDFVRYVRNCRMLN